MTKKSKKEVSHIEDDFLERFWKLLPLFPITLILGTSTQLIFLAQYNAFALFSWTQVVNDTIMLCVPFSILAVWAYFGKTDSEYVSKKSVMVGRYFATFFIGIVLVTLMQRFFPWFKNIPTGLFLVYMTGLAYYHMLRGLGETAPAALKQRNFWRPTAMFFCVLASFGLAFYLLGNGYSYFTQRTYLHLESWKDEKIRYMNDKYIIYGEGKVAKNNDSINIVIK